MQINLGLSLEKQEELSQAIAEKIVRPSGSTLRPYSFQSNQDYAFTVTAEYLVHHLAQLWAKELGQDPCFELEAVASRWGKAGKTPALSIFGNVCYPENYYSSLPGKRIAKQWLNTFLNGPNKLFRICDPAESGQLLDSLYRDMDQMNRISRCLIFFQLATGGRFAEDTQEHVYNATYKSACRQMEECIEEDDGGLLWIVPMLLLTCVYSMNTGPKMCWLTLGEYDLQLLRPIGLMFMHSGTAIRIAQMHRIDLEPEHCPNLSDDEYSRQRQVWQAAIFLDA